MITLTVLEVLEIEDPGYFDKSWNLNLACGQYFTNILNRIKWIENILCKVLKKKNFGSPENLHNLERFGSLRISKDLDYFVSWVLKAWHIVFYKYFVNNSIVEENPWNSRSIKYTYSFHIMQLISLEFIQDLRDFQEWTWGLLRILFEVIWIYLFKSAWQFSIRPRIFLYFYICKKFYNPDNKIAHNFRN